MTRLGLLLVALVAAVSAAPESRIVGGEPVTIEEFPYIVSLTYFYPGPAITVQRCVGSLLSSWHVVTTAYCFAGAVLDNMQVRAGSTNSLVGGTLVSLRDVAKHPNYVELPREADVAVVFLSRALGISNTINVLYLPPSGFSIPDGFSTKVVSWGFDETDAQLDLLKTINLDKVNVDQCRTIYAGSPVVINDDVICASAVGKGMCRGDSGAPMVINNVVVGVFSFLYACGADEHPDVFARIDRYTNWILEVATSRRSSDPTIRAVPTVSK